MIKVSRNAYWLAVVVLGSVVACANANDGGDDDGGSNNNKSGSSNAGNGSLAGSSNGAGGTTSGTAGTGTGTSGSGTAAGSGNTAGSGAGGGAGFACAGTKPTGAAITEFADLMANAANPGQFTFTAGIPGGTFAYQPAVFTLTDASGALNVKGNVKNYDGFGVYLGACMDLSGSTGVSFNIKGNAGPSGKLSFRFQSNANMPVNTKDKKGACVVPAGTADPYPLCHDATFDISVKPEGGVVEVKFSDVMGGVPNATVTGNDIVGLEWAFPWLGDTDTAYDVDVTLDDIKLLGGAPGGGGSGGTGAGGSAGSGGTGGV